MRQVLQKRSRVSSLAGKRVEALFINARAGEPGRARLRQPEPRRERAPALAPRQSYRFVNKPSPPL